jgi:Zn-finger nucleic acid-binding protein
MQAETLNCPNCGAATSTAAPVCQFCNSRLATVACPSCFAMMFSGSRHCPRCGAVAATPQVSEAKDRKCPRCQRELALVKIGATAVLECEQCFGLWIGVASFEKICADHEQQAAVLGQASHAPVQETSRVKYVPCPECSQLMNRMNFARCSGVIVDVCKQHGTWFDCDELSRIVEFIRDGGLNASRAKEKLEIAEQREQLRQEQLTASLRGATGLGMTDDEDRHRLGGIASASGLLKFLLDT